jgi:hypothetical protein
LSNAAFVTRGNLLDSGDGTGDDLIKPKPAACCRRDEPGAGLGAYRSTIVRRHGSRHDDFASPLHWRLFPRETLVYAGRLHISKNFIQSEIEKWAALIKAANIKASNLAGPLGRSV